MSDNDQSNVADSTASGASVPAISAGMQLRYFSAGRGSPSVYSAGERNLDRAFLNAFSKLKVTFTDAIPDGDGNYTRSAKVIITPQNSVIEVSLEPAGSGGGGSSAIFVAQVQSYSTSDNYLVALSGSLDGTGVFTADGSGAFNVALPWELWPAQSPGGGYALAPAYSADDLLLCVDSPDGGTGVTVSGDPVIYQDLNDGGRSWQPPAQKIELTVNAVWQEYLDCLDGSGNHWAIAKTPRLSNNIAHASPLGAQWNYTYPHNTGSDPLRYIYRLATLDSDSTKKEVQLVIPLWNCPQTTGLSVGTGSPSSVVMADFQQGGTGASVPQSGDATSYIAASVSGGRALYVESYGGYWTKASNQSL